MRESGQTEEEELHEYDLIHQLYDSVSLVHGLGYSGTDVSIVEKQCDACGHDRMVQEVTVRPEARDSFTYQCQNPMCPKHHDGNVEGMRTL